MNGFVSRLSRDGDDLVAFQFGLLQVRNSLLVCCADANDWSLHNFFGTTKQDLLGPLALKLAHDNNVLIKW